MALYEFKAKMSRWHWLTVLQVFIIFPLFAYTSHELNVTPIESRAPAGGFDGGGTDIGLSDRNSIKMRIEDGSLKRAAINYLKSIKVDSINNVEIKSLLQKITVKKLVDDINKSEYRFENICKDGMGHESSASTSISHFGGAICFNGNKIFDELKGLSQEEVLLKLATVALHEHIHHFQKVPRTQDDLKLNEAQAYNFQSYVLSPCKI